MTEHPARTPYCTKIRYGITGAPETTGMEGSYASGLSIDPTLVELVYSTAREGRPASLSASVRGWVMRNGARINPDDPDDQMLVHFKNGPHGWPAWLTEEARLHDPAAATVPASAPTGQAAIRDRIAALFRSAPGQERLGDATPGEIADAVLAVLPAPVDRAAILRAEADRIDETREPFPVAVQNGITWATAEMRRHAVECPQCGSTGACNGGPCPLRRLADAASGPGGAAGETQQPTDADVVEAHELALSFALNGAETHQPECTASLSGDCLREAESETACDTEAGECVHGGKPGGEAQQDEPEALPLLFWDEPAGVVYEDGRITAWLSRAVSLAHSIPAGQLILQADAGARLRRALTTALNDADDATAEHHTVDGTRYLCHTDDHYCQPAVSQPDGEA